MTPALAPLAPVILGHGNIGVSTGCMAEDYGDWPKLVETALSVAMAAAELSALSEHELPGLAAYLASRPALPFAYVSVHAPTKARERAEGDVVAQLVAIAPLVDTIVVHPDCLSEVSLYAWLGRKVAVENVDRRKDDGRTAAELAPYFEELPDAGLCLDVAHASSIDPSLRVAHEILDEHGQRLRQVHLSSLDDGCHHRSLTAIDEERFSSVLDRCRDVPWILEAAPTRLDGRPIRDGSQAGF